MNAKEELDASASSQGDRVTLPTCTREGVESGASSHARNVLPQPSKAAPMPSRRPLAEGDIDEYEDDDDDDNGDAEVDHFFAESRCNLERGSSSAASSRQAQQPRRGTKRRGGVREHQRRQELVASDGCIHALSRFHRGQASSKDMAMLRQAFGGAAMEQMRAARDGLAR